MFAAVVALLLGLALLVFAAGLFWRASRGTTTQHTASSGPGVSAESVEPVAPTAPEPEQEQEQDTEPEPEQEPEPVVAAEPVAEPIPGSIPEPISESRQDPEATDSEGQGAAARVETSSGGLFAGRRSRRQWAQSHGYEYAKEDRYLPGEWPTSLMSVITADAVTGSATTVARDLVSGFSAGHQFHIAEVNGVTVVALRRDVFSPVKVHLSDAAAMPAGMRHSELCDRPPYTGYSSDNRALDRMLDSRVDGALHALAGSVSDVAFSGTWLAMKMSRRTDPPIWDHVIVQGRALVAAARVLPPRVTTQELDMTNADPTRPRVRTVVDAPTEDADVAPESPDAATPAHRGHLRAVPDRETTPPPASEATTTGETEEREERPRMERSSTPVDFPTRSEGQTRGDTSSFQSSRSFPSFSDGDEEVDAEPIPAVGEDPDHSRTISGGGPRVIRTAERRSTIFGDSDEPASTSTSTEVDVIGDTGASSRGRHRAPSARHARDTGEAGDGGEYPEVDAEVVDPEDS